MIRVLAVVALCSLSGCAAIGALPVVAQIPIWGSIVVGGAAVGDLAVDSLHDCHVDHGCTELPVPK